MSPGRTLKAYCICGRGIETGVECPCGWTSPPKTFTQIDIDAAVAAEREACAKLCDGIADEKRAYAETYKSRYADSEAHAYADAANVIRARGKP